MGRRGGPHRGPRGPLEFTTVLLAVQLAACSGSAVPVGSIGSAAGPSSEPTDDSAGGPSGASGSAAVPRGWQGTITFHAVLNTATDDTSTSGQGVFQDTTVSHSLTKADVTDAFTVSGVDPADMTFGIDSVKLSGPVANHGTTLERSVFDSDKHNALGCHYTEEVGSEVSGSWTGNSTGPGEIRFLDDGSYTIRIGVGGDLQTGEMPPSPQLPKRLWDTTTIVEGAAIDCPPPGPVENTTDGPVVEWASSILGSSGSITGKLDPANPGSVVDGSAKFDITLPQATLTVTWHLVHDGPITLPHS